LLLQHYGAARLAEEPVRHEPICDFAVPGFCQLIYQCFFLINVRARPDPESKNCIDCKAEMAQSAFPKILVLSGDKRKTGLLTLD